MKKMVLMLAMLATLVGLAFSYSKTVITYYNCGEHIKSSKSLATDYYNEDGKTETKTSSTKCPTCEAQKKAEEEKRQRENVCNVLKGADYEAYSRTPECNP